MSSKLLETAVLNRDLPDHGLKRGDVGAVVEVYSRSAYEVEFVRGSGVTQALVTLRTRDLRRIGGDEVLAVRPLQRPGPRGTPKRPPKR